MVRRASWATFAGEASSWSERRVSTHMASALWWCESGIKLESRSIGLPVTITKMNWNDAAEDLLQQILAQTPRPVREAAETQLRGSAERLAEDDGKNRVGVETVIAAWVANTPEAVRSDLPRQMERFGLDPEE